MAQGKLMIPIILALLSPILRADDRVCNVLDFGAVGDLRTLDTHAIQKAIDACHAQGGGAVLLPAGREFLSGTLTLKSGVTLEIQQTAMLRGSRNLDDYVKTVPDLDAYSVINYSDYALIQAIDAENVGIRGRGVIDGDGVAVPGRTGYGHLKTRPYILRFVRCRNVEIRDVILRNPNFWTQHYLECDNVHIDGVTVRSLNLVPHQPNGDGLGIDGCRHVLIENVDIESEDDGIAIKSTSMRPMTDVLIRNCTVSSNVNAIKLGTETHGTVQGLVVRDCRIPFAGRAALSVMSVDGARIEDITFENIEIERAAVPLFVRLGDRGRTFKTYAQAVETYNDRERVRTPEDPDVGIVRNITFRNIVSRDVYAARPPKKMSRTVGSAFSGVGDHAIQNLLLENLDLTYAGGITDKQLTYADVPERPAHYPTSEMFGELPAWAFYFRHVDGLRIRNVTLRTLEPDHRAALVFDDVRDARLANVSVPRNPDAAPAAEFFRGADGARLTARSVDDAPRIILEGAVSAHTPQSETDAPATGETE